MLTPGTRGNEREVVTAIDVVDGSCIYWVVKQTVTGHRSRRRGICCHPVLLGEGGDVVCLVNLEGLGLAVARDVDAEQACAVILGRAFEAGEK